MVFRLASTQVVQTNLSALTFAADACAAVVAALLFRAGRDAQVALLTLVWRSSVITTRVFTGLVRHSRFRVVVTPVRRGVNRDRGISKVVR